MDSMYLTRWGVAFSPGDAAHWCVAFSNLRPPPPPAPQPELILQRVSSAKELSRGPSAPLWAWVGNSELGMEQHRGWSVPVKNSCICSSFTWKNQIGGFHQEAPQDWRCGLSALGCSLWALSESGSFLPLKCRWLMKREPGRESGRHFQHGGSISIRQINCHKSLQWCWRSVAPVPHASALWPSEVRGTHSNLASVRSLVNLIFFQLFLMTNLWVGNQKANNWL